MTGSYFDGGWQFAKEHPDITNLIQAMKYTSNLPTVLACDCWADGFIAYRKVLKDREKGIAPSTPDQCKSKKRGK